MIPSKGSTFVEDDPRENPTGSQLTPMSLDLSNDLILMFDLVKLWFVIAIGYTSKIFDI
jgi:hypothetical protein